MEDAFNRDLGNDEYTEHTEHTEHIQALGPEALAVESMRTRLAEALPRHMSDVEVIKFAFAAALRDPAVAICVLFGSRITKEAVTRTGGKLSLLAASPQEFGALFNWKSVVGTSDRIVDLERSNAAHGDLITKLQAALQMTFISKQASEAWARPAVRCAAAIAERMVEHDQTLRAVVGEVMRGDARRIEQLQFDLLDEEDVNDAHLLTTCEAIEALANAACGLDS